MAVSGDPAAEPSGTVRHFGAPIVGTEHPKDVWRPGGMTTFGSRSLLHDGVYEDLVIRPAGSPSIGAGGGLY